MTIITREADLQVDRERIVSFLREYLTPESDDERFDWLYLTSPAGRVLVRIAAERESCETVGVAAAFPRQVHLGNDLVTSWVFGDFCIAPKYRSGGPALILQRSLLDDVRRTSAALYYDFPSASMMAIYRRLQVREFGQMIRFVRHIRCEPIVRRVLPYPPLYRPASAFLDLVARTAELGSPLEPSLEIRIVDQPFSEEFSVLDSQMNGKDHARIAKTAEYLNWRFRSQPHRQHTLMTAAQSGALVGFMVFSISGEAATIQDLTAVEQNVVTALIRAATVYLRDVARIKTLHFPLLSGSHLADMASRAGFRARERSPVVLSPVGDGCVANKFMHSRNWTLVSGDRDS